jgi:type II secretory pathway pseudopilin PulG
VARDDGGYTLVELLVGIVIGMVVLGAAVGVVSFSVQAQPERNERAAQIQDGRVMIERMVRELRQGEQVFSASATGLSVLTYVNSTACGGTTASTKILCRVTYACGSSSCTRTERAPDNSGAGATTTVVSGITGPNVFCYAPRDGAGACGASSSAQPEYVAVRLVFPDGDGDEAITLDDGASLRNFFTEAT